MDFWGKKNVFFFLHKLNVVCLKKAHNQCAILENLLISWLMFNRQVVEALDIQLILLVSLLMMSPKYSEYITISLNLNDMGLGSLPSKP